MNIVAGFLRHFVLSGVGGVGVAKLNCHVCGHGSYGLRGSMRDDFDPMSSRCGGTCRGGLMGKFLDVGNVDGLSDGVVGGGGSVGSTFASGTACVVSSGGVKCWGPGNVVVRSRGAGNDDTLTSSCGAIVLMNVVAQRSGFVGH